MLVATKIIIKIIDIILIYSSKFNQINTDIKFIHLFF